MSNILELFAHLAHLPIENLTWQKNIKSMDLSCLRVSTLRQRPSDGSTLLYEAPPFERR
jgi:hypothetical protein